MTARAPLEIRLVGQLREIGAQRWNALVAHDAPNEPFLSYQFLSALEESGCASRASGWTPQFLTLWDKDELAAAIPLYLKTHSYGEYVFDWAWADAYERNGLRYYPKLLSAIPFTPVSGARLLARDEAVRAQLAAHVLALAQQSGVSSLHILLPRKADAALLGEVGLMRRQAVQFHWNNRGFASFDDFLATLERKKRKNILAERRHVRDAGVTLERRSGTEISQADWEFFLRCYENTYREHYSSPYLNLDFFERVGRTMPDNFLLVIASRGGRRIASSLIVTTAKRIYGRYWGTLEHVPCLHFECAYYQPLEYCIERGIEVFEGGAQGEHKMARGFLPVVTHSLHWLAHPAFAAAVDEFLARETRGVSHYFDELNERNPYKSDK